MFNIGLKSDVKIKKREKPGSGLGSGQNEHMIEQVKKILEQKGQGLIVMVRG